MMNEQYLNPAQNDQIQINTDSKEYANRDNQYLNRKNNNDKSCKQLKNISTQASKNSTKNIKYHRVPQRRQDKEAQKQTNQKQNKQQSGRLFTFMNSTKELSNLSGESNRNKKQQLNLKKKIQQSRIKRQRILSQILFDNKVLDIQLNNSKSKSKSPITSPTANNYKFNKKYSYKGLKNKNLTPKNVPKNKSVTKINKTLQEAKDKKLHRARSSIGDVSMQKQNQKKKKVLKIQPKQQINKPQIIYPNTCRSRRVSKNQSKKGIQHRNLTFFSKEDNKQIHNNDNINMDQHALLRKKSQLQRQLLQINQSLFFKKKQKKIVKKNQVSQKISKQTHKILNKVKKSST